MTCRASRCARGASGEGGAGVVATALNHPAGAQRATVRFAASAAEEAVHPGLYKRRDGKVNLSTLGGPGFGYRADEIERQLPELAAHFEK